MVRTQVQLDEATYEALRRRAFEERKSISAVVREVLATSLSAPPGRQRRDPWALSFVGTVHGDGTPVARRHDEALGEGGRW